MDLLIVWDAEDATQVIALVASDTPDVLLLDLSFAGRGFDPVTAVRDLRARFSQMAVLILTAYDDPVWVEELLRAGAQGYVVKSDDLSLRLADAIRVVAQGRTFLSPTAASSLTLANKKYTLTTRERAILRLAAEGQSNPEIATALGVSDGTVRNHISNIYAKLEVTTLANKKYTLTTRERAILRLAAEGQSNPEIATALGVSDGTVRNHISNIYAKLEVTTRDGAIRAAQHMRELPKPGASVRHELQTPLHTLLGVARLLENKLARDGQLLTADAEMLHLIVLEAQRLDGLLDDLTE